MYHLGERSVRIREVESSNLFRSTIVKTNSGGQGVNALASAVLSALRLCAWPCLQFSVQPNRHNGGDNS